MKTEQALSATGANDGDALLTLTGGRTRGMRCWAIETLAGSCRVYPSLNGTDFATKPLVLSQEPNVNVSNVVTESEGTFVASTTVGRMAYFFGEYAAIKFVQHGATPSQVRILGTESFGYS